MSPDDPAVAELFRRSLRAVRAEAPSAYHAMCEALAKRTIGFRVGAETFSLRGDGRDVWVADPGVVVTARVETTARALLDIIDGKTDLLAALLEGRVAARAAADDAAALHEALMAYVHGAVTAPSCAGLRRGLAAIAARQGDQNRRRIVAPANTET